MEGGGAPTVDTAAVETDRRGLPEAVAPDHRVASAGDDGQQLGTSVGEGAPEPELDCARASGGAAKKPHPRDAAPAARGGHATCGYATCLDRFFVQEELRWAKQYHKRVIVVFEAEERRASHFDHGKAMAKYKGRNGSTS